MKPEGAVVETITKTIQAIQNGRVDEALGAFEKDAVWRCATALPEAGDHAGHNALRKLFGAVRERYRNDLHVLHLTVSAAGDHAFAEFTRAKSSDAYGPGSEHVLAAFHVVMGKIREVREFVFRRS